MGMDVSLSLEYLAAPQLRLRQETQEYRVKNGPLMLLDPACLVTDITTNRNECRCGRTVWRHWHSSRMFEGESERKRDENTLQMRSP